MDQSVNINLVTGCREREREIVQGRVAVIVLWSLSRSIVLCWAGLFQTDREERPALE